MSTSEANAAAAQVEILREEVEALKDRLADLGEASIGISQNPESRAALQEIVAAA